MLIEYCCLVEGSETLHLIRPQENGANDNQYVFIFEGISDRAVLCLIGDWEFESVMHCFEAAGTYLTEPAGPSRKTFSVGSLARAGSSEEGFAVGAKVAIEKATSRTNDSTGRFTLTIADDAQTPFIQARRWKGIDDRTFRINRTDVEFERIGRLFGRLESATFDVIFETTTRSWFLPSFLITPSEHHTFLGALALESQLRGCISHINEICPSGFSSIWTTALSELQSFESAKCVCCDGYFARNIGEKWKKKCIGCFYGNPPTSHTEEEIANASIVKPWLLTLKDFCDES
ncbi:hypothetical protein [Pseudoduganella sp. R-43]|uniref:hypothetical protein n=1 Tax=Pseudoduganella sp. R-43 TaxID=3404063 RepID=UPI003CFB77B6